jgi:hypothetical protein
MGDTINKIVNRGVFGGLFLLFIGIISMISATILGMGLSWNLQDLGSGIADGNIMTIVLWAVGVLILGGIAVIMTQKMSMFKILGRGEKDNDANISAKHSWFALIALGVLISVSLGVLEMFWNSIGGSLDVTKFGEAVVSMDIMNIVTGLLGLIAVGFIVVFLASRLGSIKKAMSTGTGAKLTFGLGDK